MNYTGLISSAISTGRHSPGRSSPPFLSLERFEAGPQVWYVILCREEKYKFLYN